MTDEDEQSLIAMNAGFTTNNPFNSSILKNGESRRNINPDNICDDTEFDEDEDRFQSLQDISDDEKINDQDFIEEE